MKLTKPQQTLLTAIRAHGYIHSIPWHCSRTTSVPGYPGRVTDAMLTVLRRAKLIEPKVIKPRVGVYPDGRVNSYKVSSVIYVPTLPPTELPE